MDRLDALRALVLMVDEGSLAAVGRRTGRSPATMTRSLAALEASAGARLFERTTRYLRLTEAGARYVKVARRLLAEADTLADFAQVDDAPAGLLTLTAPRAAGTEILRPILHAFLDQHPRIQARILLLDRVTNLVEEGFDAALRLAHLPDSSLMGVRVGSVRRVVCASPAYLANRRPIKHPSDLVAHDVVGLAETPQEAVWSFARGRTVRFHPRLAINSIAGARASAIEGRGVARLLSYQVADDVRAGRLVVLLGGFEPPPLPAHIVAPKDRLLLPKTRALADFITPRLKVALAARQLPATA
jgi:DNA-binding transcriptional LysR family regulator